MEENTSSLHTEAGGKKKRKAPKCKYCGSDNVGLYIKGEPVFICNDCGKYLGTPPVPSHTKKKDKNVNESFEESGERVNSEKLQINSSVIAKYKDAYPFLKHFRVGIDTKGILLVDKNDKSKVIGAVNTEKKQNEETWVQALEVTKEYQRRGIGTDLLKIACDDFGATLLSVRKTNEGAISLYKKYGFKVLRENDSQYIMGLNPDSDYEEACKDLDHARRFLMDVKKVAKKYDANYFIVTDGASAINNNGNPAVKHARDCQIQWEKEHNFDPDEDWRDLYEKSDCDFDGELHLIEESSEEGERIHLLDNSLRTVTTYEEAGPYSDKKLDLVIALQEKLTKVEYGYMDDTGKVVTDKESIGKKYRYQSPEEFEKNNAGICWDFVSYQTKALKKIGCQFTNFYIELSNYDTHTFSVVKMDDKFIYLEASFGKISGVYEAAHLEEIFSFVLTAMVQYASENGRKIPDRYLITSYQNYVNYGCNTVTFMNDMRKMKKVKSGLLKPMLNHSVLKRIDKAGYMEDGDSELFLEDAIGHTMVLKNLVEKRITTTLQEPANDRKYKRFISEFIDRNIEKLTTSGPVYLIVFGDDDQKNYFELFGITKEEIVESMVALTKGTGVQSDFKYLRQNPIFVILYFCIRYYTKKNDQKGLNSSLSLYSLAVYWSIYTKYFPHGVIEPVMQFTIDNLTDKFLIKKSKHIFGTLVESIQRSYKFHKSRILQGGDDDVVAFIQRIQNDQNSLIKKVANEYMKNYREGNAVRTRNDDYDPDNPILDAIENATTAVQAQVDKVTLPIITDGVDLVFAEASAKMAGISVADCRLYLLKIIVQKNLNSLQNLIESILFLFIYEEKRTTRDIKSQYFLAWGASLFKKTNSKDENIKRINTILEKWAEESGIYDRFKREASRINYKKAIFFYIILSIQKYS